MESDHVHAGIFFWCPQGSKFGPFPNGIQVAFFPNLKKKSQSQKKKKKKKKNFFFFFFFLEFSFSHHTHTHTHKLHDDNLLELHPISFNLMAIVCVIANFVFKLTKNAVIVCLENFPK